MSRSLVHVSLGWSVLASLFVVVGQIKADDWPQWMGASRDGKVTGFAAPSSWPEVLSKKWSVQVGNGVSTPALVGERLYVFARQGEDEVLQCLNAQSGEQIWEYRYAVQPAVGPSGSFPGPRSSPTVADGKVVVYGVRGNLVCLDAATGQPLWQSDEAEENLPRFFTSSSPIIANGLCVAQRGGEDHGSTIAYDLSNGSQRWTWQAPGTAYASPKLANIDGQEVILAESDESVVALSIDDGTVMWEMAYAVSGRGYNAATPIVENNVLYLSGSNRGVRAIQLKYLDGSFSSEELWSNQEHSVQYNTPVLKNGHLFGLSDNDELFCIDAKTGQTTWSEALREGQQEDNPQAERGGRGRPAAGGEPGQQAQRGQSAERGRGFGERGRGFGGGRGFAGRGGFGGGRPRPGYGSIVDAGSVLFVLTPAGELSVIAANAERLERIAKYPVADGQTYAFPIIAGGRIYIKDGESLTRYAIN